MALGAMELGVIASIATQTQRSPAQWWLALRSFIGGVAHWELTMSLYRNGGNDPGSLVPQLRDSSMSNFAIAALDSPAPLLGLSVAILSKPSFLITRRQVGTTNELLSLYELG